MEHTRGRGHLGCGDAVKGKEEEEHGCRLHQIRCAIFCRRDRVVDSYIPCVRKHNDSREFVAREQDRQHEHCVYIRGLLYVKIACATMKIRIIARDIITYRPQMVSGEIPTVSCTSIRTLPLEETLFFYSYFKWIH